MQLMYSRRPSFQINFFIALIMLGAVNVRAADTARPASSPATTQSAPTTNAATNPTSNPTLPPAPAAKSYSQTEIASQAESTSSELESITRQLQSHGRIDAIAAELPLLTQEVASRASESAKIISPSVSIDLLRALERDWNSIRSQLSVWQNDLHDRSDDLEKIAQRLQAFQQNWSKTLSDLQDKSAEPELLDRLRSLVKTIAHVQDSASQQQSTVQTLFNRVNVQDVSVSDELLSIHHAQERAFRRLTERDSPPLWESFNQSSWGTGSNTLTQEGVTSLGTQTRALGGYLQRATANLLIHLATVMSIAALLIWMRPFVREHLATDVRAKRAAVIFGHPLLTSFVLAMIASIWIYPDAPRLFWAILGSVALIPIAIVLRGMVSRALRPLVYVLIIFSFLGLLQSVLASLPLLSRWLYLIEMGGTGAFTAWYLWHRGQHIKKVAASQPVLPGMEPKASPAVTDDNATDVIGGWRGISYALRIALLMTLVSAVANILGYVALAKLLAGGLLTSAYLALLLHAGVVAADTLFLGAMNMRPLNLLRMVRDRGATIRFWVYRALVFASTFFWIWMTLDALSIRQPIENWTWSVLGAEWKPGPFRLSLGGALAFAMTVTGAFVLSRIARFMLEEDVYPRVRLGRGIPYAISTILHYAILLFGFLAATSTIYDLAQFTILASAFGVGLGFGMQNIVNNFVSGLILLFERPVQVGDVIEIAGNIGTVIRIGIRASVVTTTDSAEIIIPNGQLISDRVTNWTLSNRKRGLTISVTIARTNDPERVTALLVGLTKALPGVSERPIPTAVVSAMNAASFTYDVRCSVSTFEDWAQARSNLLSSINNALEKNGLTLV